MPDSHSEAEADYVIVGAGTAGCVLAARLSESGRHRVVLLEAGGEDDNFWIHAPLGFGKLYDDARYNWRYEGEPEPGLGGARMFLPRGKVLGGTGSINGMIHSPAHRSDFEHWRSLGNEGWGYDEVLRYFKRSEDHALGASAYHAVGGPLRVSTLPRNELADAFIAAAGEAGYARKDPADRSHEDGFGYNDIAIHDGRRVTSATGYLRAARRRGNLDLRLHAQATRIRFEGRRAVGVDYLRGGELRTVRARREVIVAGGAFNSPALLQHSGVGPAALLLDRGIGVVADVPGVGENLQDHFAFWGAYRCTRPITANDVINHPLRRNLMGLRYLLFRSGLMSRNASYASGCLRTDLALAEADVRLTLLLWCRSTTGRANDKFGLHPFSSFTVIAALLHPQARGTVRIRASAPETVPEIRFNFLQHDDDRVTAIRAMRAMRRIMAGPSIAPYVREEFAPGAAAASDAELGAYVSRAGRSNHHACGTCRMGPLASEPLAVVDPRLRVRDLQGLRVVDASIMPRIVAGNPNSAVVMIGEKGAAMILEDAGRT